MPSIHKQDEEPLSLPSSLDLNPLRLFDIAKSEGRPLYAAAPMVRYSKLAFRETVAQYGVDLCWTPMILAKEFNRSVLARDSDFTISSNSPATIVQFGVNCPLELSRATSLLAPYVNGIDINCGCPQSWACAETLGAALMHKRELVAGMVKSAKDTLEREGFKGKKTVSVKIRIHKDLRDTVDFIKTVTDAGADFITIHGRTRSTPSSTPVSLTSIKFLRPYTHLPVLSNGDIFTKSDAFHHVQTTNVDGVMAARGLLENPGLFAPITSSPEEGCRWDVVETFMNKVVKAPIPFKLVVHHLSEMMGSDHSQKGNTLLTKEQRRLLIECKSFLEVVDFLDEVREESGGLRRMRWDLLS